MGLSYGGPLSMCEIKVREFEKQSTLRKTSRPKKEVTGKWRTLLKILHTLYFSPHIIQVMK